MESRQLYMLLVFLAFAGFGNSHEEIQAPMCRGMVNYDYTQLPNRFGRNNQYSIHLELEPMWELMDRSENIRYFLCALYLPKSLGNGEKAQPCYALCRRARSDFFRLRRSTLLRWRTIAIPCGRRRRIQKCVKPPRLPRRSAQRRTESSQCQPYNPETMPMCRSISQYNGTLENYFFQADEHIINREMQQYQWLIDTGCHPDLALFLCLIFKPVCLEHTREKYKILPCGEFCDEIESSCKDNYETQTQLRWNARLQCHRYRFMAQHFGCVNSTHFETSIYDE